MRKSLIYLLTILLYATTPCNVYSSKEVLLKPPITSTEKSVKKEQMQNISNYFTTNPQEIFTAKKGVHYFQKIPTKMGKAYISIRDFPQNKTPLHYLMITWVKEISPEHIMTTSVVDLDMDLKPDYEIHTTYLKSKDHISATKTVDETNNKSFSRIIEYIKPRIRKYLPIKI